MDDLESLVLLNAVNGLGPKKLGALISHFKKPNLILKAKKEVLLNVEGINEKLFNNIKNSLQEFDLKRELGLIKRHNVKIIAIYDKEYPGNLKAIYDPPPILYVKGTLEEADRISLSIVGSRRASLYGLSSAGKISFELASRGITIISGLARGIDTASHKGALQAKGRTIAVLGNGLASVYPPENKDLSEKICGSGCLISEFSMEAHPDRMNFPKRNRVISGLSLGVLVVEAAKHSGALITADFALSENREVFAMPGKIDSLTSQGTHSLIKEGAKLVENSDDILVELKDKIINFLKENPEVASGNFFSSGKKSVLGEETGKLKNILGKDENTILSLLSNDEPIQIDEIIAKSGFSVNRAAELLLKLLIRNIIKELPGKKYILR